VFQIGPGIDNFARIKSSPGIDRGVISFHAASNEVRSSGGKASLNLATIDVGPLCPET